MSPPPASRIPWYTHFRNPLSAVGFVIALGAGLFHLSLFVLDAGQRYHNPYLNIWFFVVDPPFVFGGVGIALAGAWRQRRRLHRGAIQAGGGVPVYTWRGVMLTGALTLLLLVPFFALTSYTGYNYTDSVEFCGQVCHVPMNPVYTAYQNSPHARVECSHCHIGEGASWFVRSKLSGTRQVFATLLDSFARPIDTPIVDLRPARETCERCHWPEKAFGAKVVDLPHFACDEASTPRPLSMVLKTGGGDPEMVELHGIHWHLHPEHQTEYVTTDADRLVIPWVRVTTPEGARVFRSDGLPPDDPPPAGDLRIMDCLDCHNRPSHNYRPPDRLANVLLSQGHLDRSLPFVKREAARLLSIRHADTAAARSAIPAGLRGFYAESYPEVARERAAAIEEAARYLVGAYERNFFPEMKTDWRSHPDHIGHKYSPGCFRCHGGDHRAADGAVIRRDCSLCHEFMEHKEEEGMQVLVPGAYRHPLPLGPAHAELDCHRCHDGGPTPPPTCAGCHAEIAGFLAGSLAVRPDLAGEPDPHHGELECTDCHEEERSFAAGEIFPLCVSCHEGEDILDVAREKLAAAEAALAAAPSSAVRDALARIPPVHNLALAVQALREAAGGALEAGER
ncbi:MAG: cytochrome c3 family protein [Planctomycetota bacterium]